MSIKNLCLKMLDILRKTGACMEEDQVETAGIQEIYTIESTLAMHTCGTTSLGGTVLWS